MVVLTRLGTVEKTRTMQAVDVPQDGEKQSVKMKPYRTPLNKRKVINKAVDEMLEAGISQRSRSPWSFPVVIVDKKDVSKRFSCRF